MILNVLLVLALSGRVLSIAPDCDPAKCGLPDCFCCGTKPPGGLVSENIPQIVLLTMSGDSVNEAVYNLAREVSQYYNNPNNCPFNMTVYTGGKGTDYFRAEELFFQNLFEIGVRTENPEPPTTRGEWRSQIQSEIDVMKLFANIPTVNSFQAPRLAINEAMYEALQDLKMPIDHSRPTCKYAYSPQILYPYTYDYISIQDCPLGQCPLNSYPGLWEVPMIDYIYESKFCGCNFIEGCTLHSNGSASEWFSFMLTNFLSHYEGNRAPFGLYLTPAWLADENYGSERMNAVRQMFDYFAQRKDVWVISVSQAVEWMKNPVKNEDAKAFGPWKCPIRPSPRCVTPNTCTYTQQASTITMHTCSVCPPCYPTATDPTGQKTPCPPF